MNRRLSSCAPTKNELQPTDPWWVCCDGWTERARTESIARSEVDRLDHSANPCSQHVALQAPDMMTAHDRYRAQANGH